MDNRSIRVSANNRSPRRSVLEWPWDLTQVVAACNQPTSWRESINRAVYVHSVSEGVDLVNLENAPLFLDKIDETVKNSPDKLAIIDLGSGPAGQGASTSSSTRSAPSPLTITYGDLSRIADECALNLLDLGIEPDEPVAYQLPTGWQFIVLTLAIWRIGATPCPLLPSLREREVSFIIKSCGSRVLVVPDKFRNFEYPPMVESIRGGLPNLKHVFTVPSSDADPATSKLGGLLSGQSVAYSARPAGTTSTTSTASYASAFDRTPHATSASDSASRAANSPADASRLAARRPTASSHSQLLYTSGTTGEPKGVLQTHQTLSSALLSHTTTLGLTADDRIWVPSPLAHQTGFLYGMMVSFYLGATGVYQATWNVDVAKAAIEEHGATFVQAAMPFLADITRHPKPPRGLRIFIATGAAIPRQLAQEANSALGCRVVGAWGSTESCLVTVGRPDDPVEKLVGTDGRVIDGMSIRIVDDEGRELPPGEEGNYQVKTPAMFITYLHHPEWYDAAMTDDGYFITGDLATIDADGYLKITGRKKDVVNRGGEKIPVVEIEDLLYQHPAILDVAVVAMPDERLGERACAYIVLNKGHAVPDLAQLTDFLGERKMAKIYWPERVEVIEEMPRTPSGKIQKYVLRNDITAKLAAETQR